MVSEKVPFYVSFFKIFQRFDKTAALFADKGQIPIKLIKYFRFFPVLSIYFGFQLCAAKGHQAVHISLRWMKNFAKAREFVCLSLP